MVVGFVILLAVLAHALWTRSRTNRHDLAVLRVIGCTRRQLDTVTAWQVTPLALGALLVGIPIGVAFGRLAFRQFAQSLAVVDDASTSAAMWVALVVAVLAGRGDRRSRRGGGRPPHPHRGGPARSLTPWSPPHGEPPRHIGVILAARISGARTPI